MVYGNYSEYKSEGKTLSDVDGNIGTYLDDDLALTTGDKVLIGGAGDDKLYIGDEQFTHNTTPRIALMAAMVMIRWFSHNPEVSILLVMILVLGAPPFRISK